MTTIITLITFAIIYSLLRYFWKSGSKSINQFDNNSKNRINSEINMSIEEFVEKYQTKKGQVKGGTLCFWGHWFGRPYDNFHTIVSVDFDNQNENLKLRFSEGETLIITKAEEIKELIGNEPSTNRLQILKAEKVYWEWNSYGELATTENLLYYEFKRVGQQILVETNSKRYPKDFADLDILKPAVLLT